VLPLEAEQGGLPVEVPQELQLVVRVRINMIDGAEPFVIAHAQPARGEDVSKPAQIL